jgi:hypothetical protein
VSTLGISIIALVVFVVGAVLVFNLWQARASRRLRRPGDDGFGERFDAPPARGAGRAAGARQPRQKAAARGWGSGTDQNAWARQRREPTLLRDEAIGPAVSAPADDFQGRGDNMVAHGGPRGDGGHESHMSADDGDIGIHREEQAYDAARELVERDDEELLPDPEEDLGPPQFEAPRLDPVRLAPLPSESPAPTLQDAPHLEEPRAASAGFENTRPLRSDADHGRANAPPKVNPVVVEALSGSGSRLLGTGGRGEAGLVDGRRGVADDVPGGPARAPGPETGQPAEDPPEYVPADAEYVVTLIPRTPVNAERLIALTSSLRHVGSKSVRIEIDGGKGRWVPLHSGTMVGCLRCSVLLANRQGPLNAVELSDFSAAMESLAGQIGARFVPPDLNQVLRQARELDAMAARLDTQVDLGVEASAPITPQKLATVARQVGLYDRGGGRYACLAEGGELLYSLMAGETADLLAFVLDVPRTAEAHDPWRSMVACASSCAQLVGGRVVDSAGRGMSVGMIDNVGLQIQKRYRELENAGLKAGSPLALRVYN